MSAKKPKLPPTNAPDSRTAEAIAAVSPDRMMFVPMADIVVPSTNGGRPRFIAGEFSGDDSGPDPVGIAQVHASLMTDGRQPSPLSVVALPDGKWGLRVGFRRFAALAECPKAWWRSACQPDEVKQSADSRPVWVRVIADDRAAGSAVMENLGRQDLTPIERGIGMFFLIKEEKVSAARARDMAGFSKSYAGKITSVLSNRDFCTNGKTRAGASVQEILAGKADGNWCDLYDSMKAGKPEDGKGGDGGEGGDGGKKRPARDLRSMEAALARVGLFSAAVNAKLSSVDGVTAQEHIALALVSAVLVAIVDPSMMAEESAAAPCLAVAPDHLLDAMSDVEEPKSPAELVDILLRFAAGELQLPDSPDAEQAEL
jgi:hypothetical protein